MRRPYSDARRLRSSTWALTLRCSSITVRATQQPPGLRALTRTGMLTATRAVDQQEPRRSLRVVMGAPRAFDGSSPLEPVDRQVIVGVSETPPCLARAPTLASSRSRLPCDCRNARKLRRMTFESGVLELSQESVPELLLPKCGVGHLTARRRCLHLSAGAHRSRRAACRRSSRGALLMVRAHVQQKNDGYRHAEKPQKNATSHVMPR